MGFPTSQTAYTQTGGSTAVNGDTLFYKRNPQSSDNVYNPGQRWINTLTNEEFYLNGYTASNGTTNPNWELLSAAGIGGVDTLTDTVGNIVTPTGGNIQFVGSDSVTVEKTGTSQFTISAPNASGISEINGDVGFPIPNSGTSVTITGGPTGLTTFSNVDTLSLEGTLSVAHGGTGVTTLTGVVIGNGQATMTAIGPAANPGAPLLAATTPFFSTVSEFSDVNPVGFNVGAGTPAGFSGNPVGITIQNLSNTASSSVNLTMLIGGTSAQRMMISMNNSSIIWTQGATASATSPYIISSGDDLGNPVISVSRSGLLTVSQAGIATTPIDSHTATAAFGGSLALGTATRNTLGYDILLNISAQITVATGGNLSLGVGPTSTPTVDVVSSPIVVAVSGGQVSFSAIIPNNYYVLVTSGGTITISSLVCQACPL